MLLEGLQLPLTTPFYSDGRLNLIKLEHNVNRYSKTPAAGLVVLSGYGEARMLSDEESRLALQSAIAAAEPEKVMLAGVSRDSVAGTLDLVEVAARLGYDAVLVRLPSVLQARSRELRMSELLSYFQTVADRSALPVVLSSGLLVDEVLPTEAAIELAAHPQIIGIVDGSRGREQVAKIVAGTGSVTRTVKVTAVFRAVTARMVREDDSASVGELISAGKLSEGGTVVAGSASKTDIKIRSKVLGFQVLMGWTAGMLEGLIAGAVGVMPGFAAAAPQACYEVLAAWKDGDESLSKEKQERLRQVAKRVEEEFGVAGVKFGCNLNGYFGGWPRLPLLPLTRPEQNEVERLMEGLKN
jgi:4-hydroxy-2-oxoglutarate aldolase